MAGVAWQVVAAVSVGLSAALWWPPRAGRLRHAEPGEGGWPAAGPARSRLLLAAGIGGCGLVLAGGLGWWAVPAALVLGWASYFAQGRLSGAGEERRRLELAAELPQACDLLAVCLESGQPLRHAVEVLGEVLPGALGRRLAEQSTRVRLGEDEAVAWAELGRAEPALAEFGRELGRAVASGASLARTLAALAAAARAEALASAEVRARRVGVRSVLPLMTCFLPAFLLLGVVPIIGGVAGHLFR